MTDPAPERTLYWHVFGGPVQQKKAGYNNFVTLTAGPVPKPADRDVTGTTLDGHDGEVFSYLGSFTHDPSVEEVDALKPEAYR